MKITLTRDDVMGILCDRFNIKYITTLGGEEIKARDDEIYWEGNPESKKEN